MKPGDLYRKLAALGLTADQIGSVLDIVDEHISEVDAKAEASRGKARERWRRWKASKDANVGQCLQTLANDSREGTRVEDNLLPKEPTGQVKKQKTLSVHSHPERDFFAEFWLAYPAREGANPKKPARLIFDRLVAKGTNPERIIEAARQLAVEHPTPTRFVPQATTWLNQERFADSEPVLRGETFCPVDWYPTQFLVARFREERGRDPPDAIHGGKTGYLLPAEWVAIAKQGFEANGKRLEN